MIEALCTDELMLQQDVAKAAGLHHRTVYSKCRQIRKALTQQGLCKYEEWKREIELDANMTWHNIDKVKRERERREMRDKAKALLKYRLRKMGVRTC